MIELFTVILMPAALVLSVYYWFEWSDAKRHTKHVKSGYKAWNTRRRNGHYIRVNSPLADTTQLVWMDN